MAKRDEPEVVGGKAMTILLVEDNPAHAEIIMRCLDDLELPNEITLVADGEAALDYLFRRGAYADPAQSVRPHLVLLDLRLPRIDGLEVLDEIRSSDELRSLPVVVLTSSEATADVAGAYAHHANSYLVKPLDFGQFGRLLSDLGSYWLGWNHYPWS